MTRKTMDKRIYSSYKIGPKYNKSNGIISEEIAENTLNEAIEVVEITKPTETAKSAEEAESAEITEKTIDKGIIEEEKSRYFEYYADALEKLYKISQNKKSYLKPLR